MRDDKFIDDLFEAARKEPAVHSISAVEQFIQTVPASTSGLILKWLKQYKMNILITTSGIIITATALLFPKEEMVEQNVISQVQEVQAMQTDQEPVKEAIGENLARFEDTAEPDQEAIVTHEKDSKNQEVNELTILDEEKEEAGKQSLKVENSPSPPVVKPTLKVKRNDAISEKKSTKEKFTEHQIVLESDKGKRSVDEFSAYLTSNLSQLSHEFTSSSSKQKIKKFTLKLSNRYEADFRMIVSGFEKLELHWEAGDDGEIRNVWYQLDSKGIKKLDFSRSRKFSVRVKYRHQEF